MTNDQFPISRPLLSDLDDPSCCDHQGDGTQQHYLAGLKDAVAVEVEEEGDNDGSHQPAGLDDLIAKKI